MAVPFFSIDFRSREWKAMLEAVITGHLLTGKSVDKLTEFLKNRHPSYHITLFPSARMGYYLLLEKMFDHGDEVIVPAMGFPLYIVYMLKQKIKPIFVDVEPGHYTLDPEKIREAITSKTKGILVTHLFGHPAYMDAIMDIADEFGLPVIEDCAQSYDSFYQGRETGEFGHAALVSCSVMKVPTTLGGGILITKDKILHNKIKSRLDDSNYNFAAKKTLRYLIFNLISVMNSYPEIYTPLSHQIFGIIRKRNPALLRKILYSGMGLDTEPEIWERPRFSGYQASVGMIQFKRAREMTLVRRKYARILNDKLQGIDLYTLPVENADCFWNYQYYVAGVKNASALDMVFNRLFDKNIHIMKEDVWNCTRYDFVKPYFKECPIADSVTPGLFRIQNNSMLSLKDIEKIGDALVEIGRQ
ncbi:DegT/DnrJ/EryC1/StrS family aminotransferase [Desulfococcaceae bacterium HSG7]|nr:DegT/DnrJ/EryC1/StrS family aminotransferase [Desulfococcaceae bacterium HSG7]